MEKELITRKRDAAELIKLLLENKCSIKDVVEKWPDYKEDGTLNKALHMISYLGANYQTIGKDEEYLQRALIGLKNIALKLEQEKEQTPIEKPFSFYEKISKPLSDVDALIASFAKKAKAVVIKDYRENIARVICWKDKRLVKYINIWFLIDHFSDETNEYEYFITVNAYKIPPLFFRKDLFDVYVKSEKKVGILKSPIDSEQLINYLNEGYRILQSITIDSLSCE